MADIFGYKRSPKPKGVFSLDGSKLNISGGSAAGYLVQNWRTNYQQEVREIFEIGSDAMYWSKGRPTGTGEIGRIVGYEDAMASSGKFFPQKAYDICDGGVQLTLSAVGGHCDKAPSAGQKLDKGVKVIMDGVVVTSIGFQMQVQQDIQLNENFGWRFAYMEVKSF